ncbi:uncharacterized protein LOC126824341 isoform X2 [Patella vulgata]|nr:uncharacterized protein LOC126824341 isoform X2 [Patella vulgata]
MKVPHNQQMHGKIGNMITLVFTYYYSFPAIGINISRSNSSGFKYEPGEVNWKNVYSVIDDGRLIFHNRSILGGGHISLIILNTTIQDYDAIYKCEVIFTNNKVVSAMIELILQSDTVMPEKEKTTTFERSLMIASLILILLTCFIIGIVVHSRKRKSRISAIPGPAGNTTSDSNHSYISMHSAVVFNANRRSTATPTESTSSNDTDAYTNPYEPINRGGIDTTKNFYMPLQNSGTCEIDQSDVVQETNVDGNSVTNIEDVQIADNDGDTSTHDTVDDDDTSTHTFNLYDALNGCTVNNEVHSYMSLPPCTRTEYGKNDLSPNSSLVDDIMLVKKRPSTI